MLKVRGYCTPPPFPLRRRHCLSKYIYTQKVTIFYVKSVCQMADQSVLYNACNSSAIFSIIASFFLFRSVEKHVGSARTGLAEGYICAFVLLMQNR